MSQIKLRVKQGKDGQWYTRVQSINGQILLSGEGHTRKRDAERSLANVVYAIGEVARGYPPSAIAHACIKTVGANGRVVK